VGSFQVRLALAIFLVVLGLALMSWALFLALSWHGLLLMGGGLLAVAGLLGIQVDRGEA
jgi:hypothetical protein